MSRYGSRQGRSLCSIADRACDRVCGHMRLREGALPHGPRPRFGGSVRFAHSTRPGAPSRGDRRACRDRDHRSGRCVPAADASLRGQGMPIDPFAGSIY
jgi:hypothetical protein